ncbi:hypothetical protein [Chelativorans sp. AA-79]|uniref:hypothetical protein n=1 Tax=Chelativorans sp. AA-79 TaxID=3028735 RepID=UPI0023F79AEA|nr:hypothetical protein [Chelativorans sp. AA-79]WEX10331.1 hypothetical protein PVE73_05055 [Chelativorans sp. AA-79]
MADQWAYWRKALEMGGGRELRRDQIEQLAPSESDPQSGFYRRRQHKDGPYLPVAIWRGEDGALFCLDGDRPVEAGKINEVWVWSLKWPISEELYRSVAAGGAWPDEPPAPIGHNQQKTGDPCEDLRAEFMAEAELANEFLKKPVQSQEQADKIAVWAKKISGIANKADGAFKVEKQPVLDEARRIDDRWRWRQDAAALVKALKRATDAWLNELRRQEEERQRKAREEAERLRREAEEKARKAAEADRQTDLERAAAQKEAERLAREAEEREKEAQARDVSAGRTGAKVSLRTFYTARITDYDKLVMALRNESEVREAVEKIANRIARTQGATMPDGAERHEERRAA